MEEKSRKRARNQKLQALILGSIAIAGGVAVALIAPNVLGAMGKLGLMPKRRQGEYIYAARQRLKKQGLLIEHNGFLRITLRGEVHLRSLVLALAKPPRLKRWDQKWRVLIFDIPEYRRKLRDSLRRQLRASGFIRVQDSVWLYPYPCEEFVALLKAEMKVGKDMLYLIVDSLEGDTRFRKAFGLPLSADNAQPSLELPRVLDRALDTILPKHDNTSRS